MKIEKEEFNKKIFSRINKLIDDYQLIKEDEKIAVALSGGKDSVLTLHALHDYQMNADFDFDLLAISVDEGIEGYRISPAWNRFSSSKRRASGYSPYSKIIQMRRGLCSR